MDADKYAQIKKRAQKYGKFQKWLKKNDLADDWESVDDSDEVDELWTFIDEGVLGPEGSPLAKEFMNLMCIEVRLQSV